MRLDRLNAVAKKRGARQKFRGAVTSLHGMNSVGVWQKHLQGAMADAGFRYLSMDYGWRGPSVLFPGFRDTQARRFVDDFHREQMERAAGGHSVIAHSFGSLILARALMLHPDLKLHRIVLFGSIVRRRFPWQTYCKDGQVHEVLNERCPADWPVKFAWIIPSGGRSGSKGFKALCPHVREKVHPHTGHSGLQTQLHYEQTWEPFLRSGFKAVGLGDPVSRCMLQ
jgi:pimeloyl-ACP methyl ester carboxylesterase